MKLTAYTDGACSANGTSNAKAGWAFVLLDEDENLIAEGAGGVDNGTNNIGELTAIIKAIEAAAELSPEKLEILSGEYKKGNFDVWKCLLISLSVHMPD